METFTLESTPGVRLRAMASTPGRTETSTQVSFSTDRKMGRVAGRRVGTLTRTHIRATTSWIRSMAMVSSSGALEANIKETTRMT